MYLRKSRADNPNETVEEVLAKHENILQELAERDLGGRIPAHCIYREVVSGETVSERPEMLNVLAQIENPRVKAVLVVEPQRLSRGDLEDCGKVVNSFRYSKTEVITTNMVYDLTNKMQRKFFEQELVRGNDYLEYTKEILLRGRIASVKRGNYIGNIPPFGYDKVKKDGFNTLEPNENAAAVLMAFEMYVNEDKTFLQIARHFDKLGIKPYYSKIWEKSSISFMLRNKHYIGYVIFGAYRTIKEVVNGEIVTRKSRPNDPEEVIIAKGKHPAIVPLELFEAAQAKIDNHPRAHYDKSLKNPLAGLIWCQKCGRAMVQRTYKHARTRIECRNRNGCGAKSSFLESVIDSVAFALEMEHLPDLEAKLVNNEGSSAILQKKQLEKMNRELEDLYIRHTRLHDFLEDGTYTKEVFNKRMPLLENQIEELKQKIFDTRQSLPQEIDYSDKVIKLKKAIEGLRDDTVSVETKNRLLKAIVKRIEYEFVAHEGKGKVRYKLHIFL